MLRRVLVALTLLSISAVGGSISGCLSEVLEDGGEPALQKYLEARGRICAMTKAASYLLWRDNFSRIRNFLLEHCDPGEDSVGAEV